MPIKQDWELSIKWNVAFFQFINRKRHPFLDAFYLKFYYLGKGYASLLFLPLFYVAGEWQAFYHLSIALLLTGFFLPTIKRIFRHKRPSKLLPDAVVLEKVYYRSFPSADAAFIVTVFTVSFFYFPPLAILLLGFLTLLICIGRLYMGVHFPIDILVGSAIGLANGLVANWLLFSV